MTHIVIEIPLFIERFKLSNSRRPSYFTIPETNNADIINKAYSSLPKKYKNRDNYDFGYKKVWKEKRLIELATKEVVIKNPAKVGKPRYSSIAGNDIWAKMHEHTRLKMIKQMKESFAPHIEKHREEFKQAQYPFIMEGEIHTVPNIWDWDVSNKWIYTKVFEDTLQRMGIIPNDNIQYITKPAALRFIPIRTTEQRKLVFTFDTDNDPRVREHLLYNLEPKPPIYPTSNVLPESVRDLYMKLNFTKQGGAGSIVIDFDSNMFLINIGKKKSVSDEKIRSLFKKIYVECINMNCGIAVTRKNYLALVDFFKELTEHGLPIWVYEVDETV